MSEIVTWKDINDSKKYDYFAFGLQPYNIKNHKLIPCPEYCHKYHITFNRLPVYHPIMENKLTEWKQKLIRNDLESINVKESILSNKNLWGYYTNLINSLGENMPHFFDNFCVMLEDIKKLKVALEKEKGKHNDRMETLEKIVSKDQYANSWEFFQMPDSEEDVNELNNLLKKAFFKKEQIEQIKQKIYNVANNKSLSTEEQLDIFLKNIKSDIDIFYSQFKKIMRKKKGMLHTTNELAKKAFEIVESKLKKVTMEDIDGNFYGTEQYTRDIKGNIILSILRRSNPHLALSCAEGQNAQKLYNRFKNLDKS